MRERKMEDHKTYNIKEREKMEDHDSYNIKEREKNGRS